MIGKDEFGNLRLRERRKGCERLCICHYEVIISMWCEELVTDGRGSEPVQGTKTGNERNFDRNRTRTRN